MSDIAVIIGVNASQGLGAAVARRFARGGFQVVVAGRTEERLANVAKEIEADGVDAILKSLV